MVEVSLFLLLAIPLLQKQYCVPEMDYHLSGGSTDLEPKVGFLQPSLSLGPLGRLACLHTNRPQP